jgi:hypothetical protein
MGAGFVVVAKVLRQDPVQVILVQHDHVVQAFPTDGADQPLDVGILPG